MKDVVRKTLEANVETEFKMQLYRSQFLVKNFTDDNITVTLGNNTANSVIGAKSWERVFNNVEDTQGKGVESVNVVKITAESDGIVEVASIDF